MANLRFELIQAVWHAVSILSTQAIWTATMPREGDYVQDIIQTGVSHSDRIARQQLAQELKNLIASEPSIRKAHISRNF